MKGVGNAILSVVARLGVVGAAAAAVWCAVVMGGAHRCAKTGIDALKSAVRGVVSGSAGFEGSSYSVVERVRSVRRLRVFRVRDCGLATKQWSAWRGLRNASVWFLYAGHVDYFVDLSGLSVRESEDGSLTVCMPKLEMSDALDDTKSTSFEFDPSGGEPELCDEYRESSEFLGLGRDDRMLAELPALQAEAIRRTAKSAENISAAKSRAQACVEFMLSPISGGRRLSFVWPIDEE